MSKPNETEDIEKKWIALWKSNKIFEADPDNRKKIFVTFPFPYMNGPLHLGHAFTALRLDVFARLKRMQGFNVLFPWAWHWTGATIAGAAKRISEGDKHLIKVLIEINGVSSDEIKHFTDPVYMARYYTQHNREVVDAIGFSVDWRREFHTTSYNPAFSKFIEWQYLKLHKKGFVSKGTYPIVWCPRCKSATGDHDRLVGVGVSPEKYTLIKFKLNKKTYLPAATFRPETVYGVTNLWLNPDVTYVLADVDGERWIISKPAADKLNNQLKNVTPIREIKGKELIGKKCVAPVVNRTIPILPAFFVDPSNGTGVVYSVPAHAPYDWIALRDLIENPKLLSDYNIPVEEVKKIKPISLISVEGYGEYPAIELIDKMNIKDQYDPKVEEATQIIYRQEFHKGKLKSICQKHQGFRVFEIKEQLINDFISEGIADQMYDLPEKVVCRCGTTCMVKILKDQWFLKYSNPEWKKLAKTALKMMKIYPEDARKNFEEVIDWLKDKACARASGLGTPLPWDKNWLVETLSDSTIYMAFYTINKYINAGLITPEQLTEDVLDYIFLNEGNPQTLSKVHNLDPKLLIQMHNEFNYWYPVDLRVSAKELLPNHLTFYIFHHVAIFPKDKWPKAIGVNGMLMIEGQPMSKSKGIFITLRDAIKTFGADVIRATLLLSAEDLDDPDWRNKNAEDNKKNLESLFNFILNLYKRSEVDRETKVRMIDNWLLSNINKKISNISHAIELLKTRTAFHEAFYGIWNLLKWYLRRVDTVNENITKQVISIWIRLLSPFVPFTAEELWERTHNKPFVSIAKWPKYDATIIDEKAEFYESTLLNLYEDINKIKKAIKISPSKIYIYISPKWKNQIYSKVLNFIESDISIKEAIKNIMSDSSIKVYGKSALETIEYTFNDLKNTPKSERRKKVQLLNYEKEIYSEAKDFLEKEFKANIFIFPADAKSKYDPKKRSNIAMPYRPAIYIE